MELIDQDTITISMRINQMCGDELISNGEFHHEVAVMHVHGEITCSVIPCTVFEQDVDEVGYSRAMAQSTLTIVQSVHEELLREHGEANVAVAERRKTTRIVWQAEKL